ncbi:MAG: response regulator, partial [Verrucomicrobiota bacterium]
EKRAHHIRSSSLLAGGIAHDLNNALAPIMLSSAMLKRIVQDPKALGMISMIEKCAGRGAELISHLLAFERGKRGGNDVIRTTQIERAIQRLSEDTVPENIEIKSDIQTDFWEFRGDTAEIGKVFKYLVENACEAMPDGGVLSINAGNRLFDENYESLAPEAKAGTYVAFVFTDTGSGIDRSVLDRVAEPFFTTKEPSQGFGFGLSSAQAIIKGHQGFMIIESELDKGTSVSVFIPAEISPSKVKGSAPPFAIRREGNGKLILVADDELFIRETIKRTLEDRGYDVIITQDGTEALAIYASRIDEIDLVVTNVEMPFMDGPSLCRALFKLKPDVKILVSSGHKQRQKIAEIKECGVEHFLAKPYTADNLADHVHSIVFENKD